MKSERPIETPGHMCDELPTSVRYIKTGRGSQWWKVSRTNGQVHLGWSSIPPELLLRADFVAIGRTLKERYGIRPGATQEFNALHDLLDAPSKHIWVTFEDRCMWWCTVHDRVNINPEGETAEEGHFWLNCERPWSNASLNGKKLVMSELPGTVTATSGFRATVCKPRGAESILRLIKGETNPDAMKVAKARRGYEEAVNNVVKLLSPKDFEHLIDLILARTGWDRISRVGGTQEGIDMESENPTSSETAYVQVKSRATQKDLDDHIERFQQRPQYQRMIFAVHSPVGKLISPPDHRVQLWTDERIADLVVRLGLGKWVEDRLA